MFPFKNLTKWLFKGHCQSEAELQHLDVLRVSEYDLAIIPHGGERRASMVSFGADPGLRLSASPWSEGVTHPDLSEGESWRLRLRKLCSGASA